MYRRYMRNYRVDEEKMRQFKQEYREGPTKRFGKFVLTGHWLFRESILGDCLLPLQEVVRVDLYGAPEREELLFLGDVMMPTALPADYKIKVRFSNGVIITVPCTANPDQAMGEFAQRCPQAKFGHCAYRDSLTRK